MSATAATKTSYPKHKIKVLLLEDIHPGASKLFNADGLSCEVRSGALGEAELIQAVADVHILGIRSKTRITEAVLDAGRRLLAVGCFCIGTNQVDLGAARRRGVAVFNAPFSNTRSVAELVIAEVIALARRLGDRSREMHAGKWTKSAAGSYEVRGKTLGIIGYGHIGRQVGVIAENLGMQVLFYDITHVLPMGNNRATSTLAELLSSSHFVTLHVPETPATREMIGAAELALMPQGSKLLNLSRGSVVKIDALAEALRSGHLGGAAIDVYPSEPKSNQEPFDSELRDLPNVLLTPHIGGSTQEAQAAIGVEVASALLRFLNEGSTANAVNMPHVEPPPLGGRHRILNIHANVPGVLSRINTIISDTKANVESQILATDPEVGYLVIDLSRSVSDEVKEQVAALEASLRTRILY